MVHILLLTALGAALAMLAMYAELLIAATFLRRPFDALPLIVAASWAVAMLPVTYKRRLSSAHARSARRYFALAAVLPVLGGVLVYILETL